VPRYVHHPPHFKVAFQGRRSIAGHKTPSQVEVRGRTQRGIQSTIVPLPFLHFLAEYLFISVFHPCNNNKNFLKFWQFLRRCNLDWQ
jgi:hypothetical protein